MASQTEISFFIISDTHSFVNSFEELNTKALSYPRVDVPIHCGNLTNVGAPEEYQHALHMLSTIPAELKLVIAGDHDLSLDEEFCSTANKRNLTLEDHRKAKAFWHGYAKSQGVTYREEGLRTFHTEVWCKFRNLCITLPATICRMSIWLRACHRSLQPAISRHSSSRHAHAQDHSCRCQPDPSKRRHTADAWTTARPA